ncbi:hypothetical protein ElyMa_005098600 [Elysia marginata]|uniref:Uncharacterized protein n=1 Tax=Elysia marginata TaxID=1093978 RepID=A0AAV4JI43_9GAST|nr:hypothetical protein ElyMa_005098600 [Elysia marginata]
MSAPPAKANTTATTMPPVAAVEGGKWLQGSHLSQISSTTTSATTTARKVRNPALPGPPPAVVLAECHKGVVALHSALAQLEAAGTHLTQALAAGMQGTVYSCVGDVLKSRLGDVFASASSQPGISLLKEMEDLLLYKQVSHLDPLAYGQTLCHVSLLLAKLRKQYFSACTSKMGELVYTLLHLNRQVSRKKEDEAGAQSGEDQAAVAREVTRLVLGLGLADGLDILGSSDGAKLSRPANSSLPNSPLGSPKSRKGQEGGLRGNQGRHGDGDGSGLGFRIRSLLDRKSPPKDERKSMFYVDVEGRSSPSGEEEGRAVRECIIPTVSVTAGSQEEGLDICQPPSADVEGRLQEAASAGSDTAFVIPRITSSGSSQLATEEELESVINLLSGLGSHGVGGTAGSGTPHMQVIPEVVIPQAPVQLSVPQIYRMPSPVSETQLEDLRSQKPSQAHRRSEGCLDLSAMGRAANWPHQHHHRASLPSVQVFSASGSQYQPQYQSPLYQYHQHQQQQSRSGFETPSPVPSFVRDSPSPSYGVSNPPSPSFFQREAPLSPLFRSSSAGAGDQSHSSAAHGQYLRVGGHQQHLQRSNMLSPLQWLAPPVSPHMGGSLASLNLSQGSSVGVMDSASAHNVGGTASPGWPPYLTPSGAGASLSPGLCSMGDASSWTGAHDSDLSDDSSTEEQFFAVGKDLSHMIGSKDGSSDEEVERERQPRRAKSCSTWPPPRPHHRPPPIRLPSTEPLESPGDVFRQHLHYQQQHHHHPFHQQQQLQQQQQHPAIHMQWSDPLLTVSSPATSSLWAPPPATPQAPPSSPLLHSPQSFPLQQGQCVLDDYKHLNTAKKYETLKDSMSMQQTQLDRHGKSQQ